MKLSKILVVAFLMFIFCITACAGLQTTSPPTPVVKWPFDVSKKDSSVNQEFRIDEYRSYYIALRFDYTDRADNHRVFALVGDGSAEDPGIAIPIHIKIYTLNAENKSSRLIYKNTIFTKKHYVHGGDGNYRREIIAINLEPGIYRVEANTTENRPEFSGTPSYLQIEPHSQIRFLPDQVLVK